LEQFQNLAELVRPVAQHPVATKRIDDILDIDDIDLIKIDVQGSELAVFQGAMNALPHVLCIQTEVEFVELYRDQPMFADVDVFLRQQGFQFHTFQGVAGRAFKPLIAQNNVNQPFRQLLWADAVYVRDWRRLQELSATKLRKFAVLAHDFLQSYDLGHLVLVALDSKTGSNLAQEYLRHLVAKT
jgi:hypothetical protein